MEPEVPTLMIRRMPTSKSSFVTMLAEGAPIPEVAQTSGMPVLLVQRQLTSPRFSESTLPCLMPGKPEAIFRVRSGSPQSSAATGGCVPRSLRENPM
ncbi:MAG: hypothetical protein BWX71_01908 [Deltaproteobacteria bacterium ADurb.Bin072]|nr:MAG: hypothetical protein BWX71_01908 [Deltaproteobacteria bacterium ADurb.Bin072]